MSLRFTIVLFSFFSFFQVHSQIKGIIKDAASREPLEFATVSLFNESDSTLLNGILSSDLGVFEFTNLNKGSYYLEVSYLGYEVTRIESISLNSQTEIVDLGAISVSPGKLLLEEIEVTGQKAIMLNKADRQIFESSKFRTAQGGSATDALKNLPSVSVDGLGEISVRGSKGFVLLINGKPIQGEASVLLNQFPANSIERIELITAPSAKYDPEGKAGMINIITAKGADNGTFAQVNVKGGLPSVQSYHNAAYAQRYGLDFTYNYKKDKVNLSLGGNFQRSDIAGRRVGDVFTIIDRVKTQFPSAGERSSNEVNLSGRMNIDYALNESNDFSLGFYAGKRNNDRLADITYYDNHAELLGYEENRLYTFQYYNHNLRTRTGDFVLSSLDYTHKFKNGSKISNSFLYEYTLLGGPTSNQNMAYPVNGQIIQDEYNTNNNPLNGFRFQTDYQFEPLKIGQLEAGYQFRNLVHVGDFIYQRKNNETGVFELVPAFSSQVDLKRQIHSEYLQLSNTSGEWAYAFGLRAEQMSRSLHLKDRAGTVDTVYNYNFFKLFPSASLQYRINENLALKAAYSKRIERTTSFKMNPFPEREHSETLEQGDPTLLPEFIDAVELGVEKSFDKGSALTATAYYRQVTNLVNRVNTVFNDTILNRIYSNVGVGKSLGLELGADLKSAKNWNNFIGLNVYNYAIQGQFDNRPVNTNSLVYSVNLNSTLNLPNETSLQFTFNYLSKRVTAQGEDSQFYTPSLSIRKVFLNKKLTATLLWQNIDMGLLKTNEQRISTWRKGEFYTTTNYIYEVDMLILNLSYVFNKEKNRAKFIKSEFGEREF